MNCRATTVTKKENERESSEKNTQYKIVTTCRCHDCILSAVGEKIYIRICIKSFDISTQIKFRSFNLTTATTKKFATIFAYSKSPSVREEKKTNNRRNEEAINAIASISSHNFVHFHSQFGV